MLKLRYAVVGAGKWGERLVDTLSKCTDCQVLSIQLSRRANHETEEDYRDRINATFEPYCDKIDLVWLAVSPGDQEHLVLCAINAGFHVIIEKPWMVGKAASENLSELALNMNVQVGVHFQYCYLEELAEISKYANNAGFTFNATFTIAGGNRLNIDPWFNFGTHLLAMKMLHFSDVRIGEIQVGYNVDNQRWLNLSGPSNITIDFGKNDQPLIQRFVSDIERSIVLGVDFPIGIEFAEQVTSMASAMRETKNE